MDAQLGRSVAVAPFGAPALLCVGAPGGGFVEDSTWPIVFLYDSPFESESSSYTSLSGGTEYPPSGWNRLGSSLLLPGDVTGDGEDDLVVFDHFDPPLLGGGAFLVPGPLVDQGMLRVETESYPIDWPGPWRGAPCGDLDADGATDLCLATGIAFGPVGDAGVPAHVTWSVLQPDVDIQLVSADLDADGAPELLLWDPRTSSLHRLTSFPTGDIDPASLADTTWTSSETRATALESAGDVTGDGREDVIVGTPERTYVLSDALPGSLETSAYAQVALPTDALAVGDFDGDGNNDLAVGGAGEVRLFLGPIAQGSIDPNTAAAFWVGREYPGDRFGFAMDAADLDGDGRSDLVIGAPEEGMTEFSGWPQPHGRLYLLWGGGL